MLSQLVVVTLFLGAWGKSDVENIISQGYPAEEHHVTTVDGYILSIQRIPYGKDDSEETITSSTTNVVFLMPGYLGGSNSFTYLGAKYGIAYNLADAGYDVWIGNSRGNSYSRSHVCLDPDTDKYQFFDFTYEDIALYDVPAMIDYVLATTKQDKVHYISHSQGGTLLYVLTSMNTMYQSKIASAHLLSGVGYETNFPNKIIKVLSSTVDEMYSLALAYGFVEFKPSSSETKMFLEIALNSTSTLSEVIVGAAVKPAVQLFQNYRDECFCRFNYGAFKNMLKYGSITPPSYDLSKIKLPVTLYYSKNDISQSEEDVLAMVKVMPNAMAHKVAKDSFSHTDYLTSKDVKELVTNYIIEELKMY